MSKMATTKSLLKKNKGPIVDAAVCRCCRSTKKCRLLTVEYEWTDKKEVYSDMFMDCFGLLLSHLDGENTDCGICATCVVRLRDSCAFRQQVLECEQIFLKAQMDDNKDYDYKIDIQVKAEPVCNDTNSDMDEGPLGDNLTMHNEQDIKVESKSPKTKPKNIAKVKKKTLSDVKKMKKKVMVQKELLNKVNKLKAKLDQMLDKPEKITQKKTISTASKKSKNPSLDHNAMVYHNAVTIAQNSYICPFHNRISIYYCYYCRDQFTNPVELREHTLTHDPKGFETMMDNKKIPKIDITRIDCRLCNETIPDLETLKNHLTKNHNKVFYPVTNEFLKFKLTMDNLTCTECHNVYPYFDVLKKHMIDHFGTHTCDICGACFLEDNSLRTHIKSHSKVEANFPCEICGKNLKSKYSRYLHVATVHEKKPTVNCYKCEASFLSYALRNRHLIEVHGDNRTFPCKLCDKVYNRRKTLMEHNRRNHLKVYRHQCDMCDQRFYLPSRLKEHMATHTGERNFRCEFCDKSYPRLKSLQEHIRTHSNERRYKCEICHSAFTQNGSLRTHMKSQHEGFEMMPRFD